MGALALALLLATAQGQVQHSHIRSGGLSKVFPSQPVSPVAFEFLPSSGVGAPSITPLCDAFASELTGSYFCLKGGGSVRSGSQAMTSAGTPTSITPGICPNGLNCGAVDEQRMDGVDDKFSTANVAAPLGDFSLCYLGTNDTGNNVYVSKDDVTAGSNSVLLWPSSNQVQFWVSANGTFATHADSAASAIVNGAEHLVCATYDFVADGTSIAKVYVDGAQSGSTVSTMPGPAAATGTTPWRVGVRGSTAWLAGRMRAVLFTEKILDAATIASMARTVLADAFTGTRGEVFTLARSSVKLCDPSDGGILSALPANRPCVVAGYQREGAATNLVLRNRDLSHAAWTKSNVTCTQTATDMNGVASAASTCTASAGNGTVLQGFTVTAATRATAFDLKRRTGTGNIDLTRDNGTTWTTVTLTSSWQRFTPLSAAALSSGGADPTVGIRIVTNGDAVDVDYVQDEAGAYSSSRILTAGTSVTRSGEVGTLPSPSGAGVSTTEGCSLITFVPGWSGAPSTTDLLISLSSTSNARVPYLQTGAGDIRTYDGSHVVTSGATYVAGTPLTVRTTWTAGGNQLRVNSTGGTQGTSVFTSLGTIDQFQIGNLSGAGAQPITISAIVLGKNSTACGSTP